ncbi:TPA: hypothetical protein ACH3X2_006343 [Trebouxia sp. C0005]
MATAGMGDLLLPSQRVIAIHPACPLSLKHEGAWKYSNYTVETVLGSTKDAEQKRAKCARCGAAVSMLVYESSKMSVEALEAIQKLVLKSCNIQHAYLHVPLAAFEDSGFFCILYSLTDKALTAEIESEGGKLTERQAVQKVAQPCLTALADLHAKGIAHGALLPHNILFNSQETACKLAGLFLPSQLSSVQSEADLQRFAAPEQDCSSLDTLVQSASAASDVFMLGAMTYEVLVGKHAFPVKNDGIGRARRWQDPELPLWLSDHAQDFLSRTLLKDAAKRSSAAQLLKHPWLKSLGFKQSMDQIPSSIEVVEPVLPPRPVLLAPPQHVTVAQPSVVQPAVSDEPLEKVQMPEEIAVTATGMKGCQHTICMLSAANFP